MLGRGKKRKNQNRVPIIKSTQVIPLDSPPNADFKDIIFMYEYETILLTKYKFSEKYQLFKENKKFDLKWFRTHNTS